MTRTLTCLILAILAPALIGCPPVPGANNPPTSGNPSAEVLQKEQEAHDLVNAQRTANGLPALQMDESLRTVARAHSEDMVARNYFNHVNPDGLDPFDRMANAGITYNTAGENLATNHGFANPSQTAVTGWMNSTGHRANILRNTFTHAGMGVAISSSNKYYYTQVFAGYSKDVPEGYVDVFYYGPYDLDAEE